MHLRLNDVEHVGPVGNQTIGYSDVHGGARKPTGPVVYCLEAVKRK